MLHIRTQLRKKAKRKSKNQATPKQRAPRGDGSVTQLPSGVWQARIRRYGHDQKRTANTQSEALDLLKTMRRTKPTTNAALARMKMSDWLERYRNEQAHTVRFKTQINQAENSKRAAAIIGRIPLNALTPSDLREFQAKLIAQGFAPTVQRQVWQFLTASLRRAFEDDIIPISPAAKVKRIRGVKPLRDRVAWTAEQCRIALETAHGSHLYLLLCCFLATRVRPNELFGLMWSDLEGDKITIRRTLIQAGKNPKHNPPKTANGWREFFLASDIVALLAQHRNNPNRAKSPDDFVFTTANGAPYFIGNFRNQLKKLCAKAGVPRLSPHELRHTGITLAILAGADRSQLSRQVGHTSQHITDLYDHSFLNEDERRKLAISLQILLKNDFPYDSLTATPNNQKTPKDTGQDTTQQVRKSHVLDGKNVESEVNK